jgi:hypothetical protein
MGVGCDEKYPPLDKALSVAGGPEMAILPADVALT